MYSPYVIFKIDKDAGSFRYKLIEPEEKLCSDFQTKEEAKKRIEEHGNKYNYYIIKQVYKV